MEPFVLRSFSALALAALLIPSPDCPAQDHQLVRIIAPFPVSEGDLSLRYPFLGGFDAPRPQFLDIDGDSDLDLMVQERQGSVMFFRNSGTSTEPEFEYVTDRFENLDVGQWFVFVDLDDDGDQDLLAERPFGRIRMVRNDGTASVPSFSPAVDTLRAVDGSVIAAEASIPTLVDVDCNGRLDLMIGRQAGTITRYEWVGEDSGGNPTFAFVEDRYEGIEVVGGIGKQGSSSLHGASSIIFSDIDADGDPDLLWGDFFEPNLILFRNTGTCAGPQFIRETDTLLRAGSDPVNTSGFNAPRVTDIDGDGNLDLFVGVQGGAFVTSSSSVENFYRFEQGGEGFGLISSRFLPTIDVGSEAAPVVADLDSDARPDVAVGNLISPTDPTRASVSIFRSSSAGLELAAANAIPFDGFSAVPAARDVDCDDDVDLLVGAFDGTLSLFLKSGPGDFEWLAGGSPYQGIDVGSSAAPAWADIDADGDADLFVGENSGTISFFRSTGSSCQPVLELETDAYAGIDVGQRSRPAFVDYDSDGDLDLFVGSDTGTIRYFRNEGSPATAAFTEGESIDTGIEGIVSPSAGDLDLDGDPDLVVGVPSGGLLYYRNDRIATGVAAGPPTEGARVVSIRTLHPNPARGWVTVEVHVEFPETLRIEVFDVLGRRVVTPEERHLDAGGGTLRIDGRGLPSGVYVLTLHPRRGSRVASPFVVFR